MQTNYSSTNPEYQFVFTQENGQPFKPQVFEFDFSKEFLGYNWVNGLSAFKKYGQL